MPDRADRQGVRASGVSWRVTPTTCPLAGPAPQQGLGTGLWRRDQRRGRVRGVFAKKARRGGRGANDLIYQGLGHAPGATSMPIRWRLTIFNALVIATYSPCSAPRSSSWCATPCSPPAWSTLCASVPRAWPGLSMRFTPRAQETWTDLPWKGVFVVVRDRDGKILARTVNNRSISDQRLWRSAKTGDPPLAGRSAGIPWTRRARARSHVWWPPDLGSLSPYLYKTLASRGKTPPPGGARRGGHTIPFPGRRERYRGRQVLRGAGATVAPSPRCWRR